MEKWTSEKISVLSQYTCIALASRSAGERSHQTQLGTEFCTKSVFRLGKIDGEGFPVAEQEDFVFGVGTGVAAVRGTLAGTIDDRSCLDGRLFIGSKALLQEILVQPGTQGALLPVCIALVILIGNGVQAALAEQQALSVFFFQDDPFNGLLSIVRVVVLVISAKGYGFAGSIVNVRGFRIAASDIEDV